MKTVEGTVIRLECFYSVRTNLPMTFFFFKFVFHYSKSCHLDCGLVHSVQCCSPLNLKHVFRFPKSSKLEIKEYLLG